MLGVFAGCRLEWGENARGLTLGNVGDGGDSFCATRLEKAGALAFAQFMHALVRSRWVLATPLFCFITAGTSQVEASIDPVFSLVDPRIEVESTSYISNGQKAQACTFPAIFRLKVGNSLCTGTLVHPRVIAYAAHCGRLQVATMGESGQGGALRSISKTQTNSGFNINKLDTPEGEPQDWAFALLKEPVNGVPIIPFASKGEYREIMAGQAPIAMAGFGHRGGHLGASSQMMWTRSRIGETCHGWLQAGRDTKNACPGDSGGPLLAQLPDKSWRVVGIASTLYGETQDGKANCGKPSSYNHYARVRPEMLRWFEKNTGLDLTPCYDVDGNEDKSSACSGFFAGDPSSPNGSWSDQCADAKRVKKPKLYPASKDREKPKVELAWPKKGSVYGVGQKVEVRVSATDNDKVTAVSLSVDGVLVKQWDKPPYVYQWEPAEETKVHFRVSGRDDAGNESELQTTIIEVKKGAKGEEKDPSAKGEGKEPEPEKDKKEDPEKDKDQPKEEEPEKDKEDPEKDKEKPGSEDEEEEDEADEDEADEDEEEADVEDEEEDEEDEDEEDEDESKKDSKAKASPTKKGSGCVIGEQPGALTWFAFGILGLAGCLRRRK